MAKMTPTQDPQSASEYDDRTTAAVKSVLIEIGQVLGSFKGKFAIIGGVHSYGGENHGLPSSVTGISQKAGDLQTAPC